jgi:hypothetical protein
VKSGQAVLVSAVGGRQGAALKLCNLVEVQAAPQPRDDSLTGISIEIGEESRSDMGVNLVIYGGKPRLSAGNARLTFEPSVPGPPGRYSGIPHHTMKPGANLVGQGHLPGQAHERFLYRVLGIGTRAPLTGVKS